MAQNEVLRTLLANEERYRQTETKETPPLYLPWAQRVLNPIPLASSGTGPFESPLPWAVIVRAFYATVFVVTTNNATNYWTLDLYSTPANTLLATFNTSAIAANTWTRFAPTIVAQPASTDVSVYLLTTATLTPGSIIIHPALALLRTGN